MKIETSNNKYQEEYNKFVDRQVKKMIGSQRFGPTYIKRFIVFYEKSSVEVRRFLRQYSHFKLRECEHYIKNGQNNKVKEKLRKKVGLYKEMFTSIIMIKPII